MEAPGQVDKAAPSEVGKKELRALRKMHSYPFSRTLWCMHSLRLFA